jgi:pimeloyl-ACP methyl ester carboxylesterase
MSTTSNDPVITSYAKAPARTITAGGVTYAYRELGPKGGIPVIFFVHLAATLDNWDPRIIDPIAKEHHVIAFDNRGVGASTGQVPDSVEAMADDAYTFIRALGFDKVDIFSFSLGGFVAQALVIKHPDLVRRLILTGTGPAGGKDIDKVAPYHLLGHAARGPDAVGPEGVPVLQPQRHRQARRPRVRQPAQGAHPRPRRPDLGEGVPDAAQGDQEVGSLGPR